MESTTRIVKEENPVDTTGRLLETELAGRKPYPVCRCHASSHQQHAHSAKLSLPPSTQADRIDSSKQETMKQLSFMQQ